MDVSFGRWLNDLRISPEHNYIPAEVKDMDKKYHHTASPFPFDPATCENLFELCEFHKAFFDAPKANIVRSARVDMNGIQCEYLQTRPSLLCLRGI